MFFFDLLIFSMRPTSTGAAIGKPPRRASAFVDLVRRRASAVGGAIGLVHHHALGLQRREGLGYAEIAAVEQRAGEEARIEEMQDRVLDAADVLVDRQPILDGLPVERRCRPFGRAESREIPGGFEEGVEGVGVAPRRLSAGGQATCFQVG